MSAARVRAFSSTGAKRSARHRSTLRLSAERTVVWTWSMKKLQRRSPSIGHLSSARLKGGLSREASHRAVAQHADLRIPWQARRLSPFEDIVPDADWTIGERSTAVRMTSPMVAGSRCGAAESASACIQNATELPHWGATQSGLMKACRIRLEGTGFPFAFEEALV